MPSAGGALCAGCLERLDPAERAHLVADLRSPPRRRRHAGSTAFEAGVCLVPWSKVKPALPMASSLSGLAFSCASMRRGRTCSDQPLLGKQHKYRRDHQNDSDDGEGIAETHDQCLSLDHIAERHDRLMLCSGWV